MSVDRATTGILLGLAALTRTVGIPVAIGATAFLARRNRRDALIVGTTAAIFTAAWIAWSAGVRDPSIDVIERFYTSYDRFAWSEGFRHPAYAWSVVRNNALGYLRVLPSVLGAPRPFVAIVLILGIAAGVRRSSASAGTAAVLFMGVPYVLAILGAPYLVARYLLPAVPVVYAFIGAGMATGAGTRHAWPVQRAVALVSATLLLGVNLLEFRHLAQIPTDAIHVGFGRSLPFTNAGFLQTAEWIRHNTPPDAILASANDPIYYVNTGRRGVRPWPYEPDRYGPAYTPIGPPEAPEEVPPLLRRLGVSYLVVDPYLPDLEGQHSSRYVSVILNAPGDAWTLVFTSDDGLHQVYKRGAVAPPDEGELPSLPH